MSLMRNTLLAAGLLAIPCGLGGCDRRETVVDVQTPAGSVEVQRDLDTGEVHVEATRDKEN